ncbi:MAG TPA: hypothetical protein VFE41_02485 [Acetobacteraceae bacterium]|nr:hypothetical protein [Acetobacteraceae bacterium]
MLAAQEAQSVNQFVVNATAGKVATSKARDYLAARAERAKPRDLSRILSKAGTPTPVGRDEVPAGWRRRLSKIKLARDPCRQARLAGDLDTLMAGLACDTPRLLASQEVDRGAAAFMAVPDDARQRRCGC